MAKKSFLGTLVKLGGIAAATALVYSRREEIRKTLEDVKERFFTEPVEPEDDFAEEAEPEIIIDTTEKATQAPEEVCPEV